MERREQVHCRALHFHRDLNVDRCGGQGFVTHEFLDHQGINARCPESRAVTYLPWIRSIAWSERIFGVEAREAR